MKTSEIQVGEKYTFTNHYHANGPMTFVVTVTSNLRGRVEYTNIKTGTMGVTTARDFADRYEPIQ